MVLKMQFESFSHNMITLIDARFNLRVEKNFNSWEDKMLMGGDCSLNSPQIYTDSCKEVLRQTMLNQEVIFQKQVNELHRLYMIQKTLMDDFGWREYSGSNLGDARRQSTLRPFINQIRYEPQANGEAFSSVPMAGSTHFMNNNYLQEGRGVCSRLQQRPIDLQLPSSHNIKNASGAFLKNEEEVKLSLSIGWDSMQKGVQRGNLNDKITHLSSQHIIDLEESVETVSNDLGFDECDNTLVKDKVVSYCEPVHLDLNKVHLDESSIHSDSPTMAYTSTGSSPVAFDGLISEFHGGACSTAISLKEPNGNDYSCNISSTSAKMNKTCDSKACTIDLESLSGPTSDHSEDPYNYGSNNEHENVDLPSNLENGNYVHVAMPEVNCEKQKEDTVEKEQTHSELKHQCCDKKEGESPETDVVIQKAAVSLIFISLGSSTSDQNFISKAKSNDSQKEEKEKPQCSLDSYESIVLKLKESREDEHCVSSNAFEANELDNRDCGIKLKRGRRMKDFQKDILPGLASLSRREIWEDVKIMEGVIRSREYKKLRANRMVTNGENWFTPVRSKRSRLNYVGRRYY
ncbi:hypothetical protein LguiB_034556 [Lonicera macranthoides]